MKLQALPQALIFDLDGTLANTLPQLALAARQACQSAGIKPPSVEEARTYVGNGVNMLLARSALGRRDIAQSDVSAQLLKKLRGFFNESYTKGLSENYEVYPGVREGLKEFRRLGIRLGVCTNKPEVFAKPLLGFTGLLPDFDFVLGGEVLPWRKPDPRPVLHVCSKLGAAPARCVMAGDSENDVQGGANAALCTVFFTYGYFSGDPDTIRPDYRFDSFAELTELMEKLAACAS